MSKRFRTVPAPSSDNLDDDALAARLLTRESRELVALPYDPPTRSRALVHNGRFLKATLESTERHNDRLTGRRRPRPPEVATPKEAPERLESRLEITLDSEDAGIFFEKDPSSGRPRVRGLTASARGDARSLAPGMILSKIAGVKCKSIEYKASLDLIRALDRPLKLTFKSKLPDRSSSSKRRRRRYD